MPEVQRTPTFVPGDDIVYVVRFNYPANVRNVSATFRNETTGAEIVLTGEASLARSTRRDTRSHVARLRNDDPLSEAPDPGSYQLARLEATTYGGKPLDFDNPPEDAFRVEDEPDETTLPRLNRVEPPGGPAGRSTRATRFKLSKGHPDKRRRRS